MTIIENIEGLTRRYADARAVLAGRVQALQMQIDRLRTKHINSIRAGVREAAGIHAALYSLIEANPKGFVKPKTLTVAGVRVGYMKQKGKVVIEDEEAVIKRIRKLLPAEQAELLIRVQESVHKPAVYDLTAGDLKRLGITVTADEDVVVIKPVDTEVDKLVNALLKDAQEVDGVE